MAGTRSGWRRRAGGESQGAHVEGEVHTRKSVDGRDVSGARGHGPRRDASGAGQELPARALDPRELGARSEGTDRANMDGRAGGRTGGARRVSSRRAGASGRVRARVDGPLARLALDDEDALGLQERNLLEDARAGRLAGSQEGGSAAGPEGSALICAHRGARPRVPAPARGEREKRAKERDAPLEAGHAAAGADDAVARHGRRERVLCEGRADGARGRVEPGGQGAVRRRFACWELRTSDRGRWRGVRKRREGQRRRTGGDGRR